MPKMIDLTGQKFGRLTVIKRDLNNTHNEKGTPIVKWICKCDCGKIVSVLSSSLREGKTKSCGCLKKELVSQRSSLDLKGQNFGRLTVQYRIGSDKNQNSLWHCKCICGNEIDVVGTSLTCGSTRSCGCLRREKIIEKNMVLNSIEIGKTYNYLTPIKYLGLKYATENSKKRRSYYLCKCELCGQEIEVSSNSLSSGQVKSCGCFSRSFGELEIENFLKEKNIPYIKEYKFNDLLDKRLLRFDFAIFNNKNDLLFLIEYDGRQHFQEGCNGWFEGKYIDIHKKDEIKNNYCLKNNIKLIRINYKENLQERLEEIFNEL